jgi:hypothetical protein
MHLQPHRAGLARAAPERDDAVDPGDRWVGGLEPHRGAEVIERRVDRLAARQLRDDRRRPVAQPVARHQDAGARVGLDGVAGVS